MVGLICQAAGSRYGRNSSGRQPPTSAGRNALSEKPIPALAPAFNPASFTDRSKVDGWFKNNCKDVLNRECTMAEKADVLSWLLTLKP